MATQIPTSMRALTLSKYCKPNDYNLATLPTPSISQPDQLLIKVRAASVNPIDVKLAAGLGKYMEKATYALHPPSHPIPSLQGPPCLTSPLTSFPYKLGYDLSGVVVAVGDSVSNFKIGDEVYSRIPASCRGSIAEYALSTASTTALKPKSVGWGAAASIPLAGQTALQSLDRGEELVEGGLRGKKVFIPGGLSGTGSFSVQLAKNVFGAGEVVSTLSTAKMGIVEGLLGKGTPDRIIDYTKSDVVKAVGRGTLDYMFDPVGGTLAAVPLMKKNGVIISISTLPKAKHMQEYGDDVALFLRVMLDVVNWLLVTWTGWRGVRYEYWALAGSTRDLERLAGWVDEGMVKPVVGMEVKLSDIEGVRKGCQQIYDAKGGVGKFVILVD